MKKASLILIVILQIGIVGLLGLLFWQREIKDKQCEYYSPYYHYHFHECPETKMMDSITSVWWEGDEAIIFGHGEGKTYTLLPTGEIKEVRSCGCDCQPITPSEPTGE